MSMRRGGALVLAKSKDSDFKQLSGSRGSTGEKFSLKMYIKVQSRWEGEGREENRTERGREEMVGGAPLFLWVD